ncbi:MAG: flavin reductase family protein [Hyphomicrobiaceae bacterium]|nr:flavin reductase family protein [Hyphomicrobiaceae bacterium]
MFYETADNRHGLRHDPWKALVVPRPIGWISSVSKAGVCNLAPYSFFNAMSDKPNYVVFGSGGRKDSVRNIEETGEFVCSLATWDLRYRMNTTSAAVPGGVDEFPLAGLTAAASRIVRPPRVKESPVALECRHWRTVELPDADGNGANHFVVFGRVVGIHIDDRFIKDGLVDTAAMRPIARLGYMDYAVVTPGTVFTIQRPKVDADGNLVEAKGAAE